MKKSRADICAKCGETRGAIMNEKLICWAGYDELGKHRFAPTCPHNRPITITCPICEEEKTA